MGFKQRWWRARAGISMACLALMIMSGGTSPGVAHADEMTNPRPATPAAGPAVLVDLADPGVAGAWTTVNDPVMGGRSTSTVGFGNGGLVFSGNISLENNGGFASARSPQDPGIGQRASGASSLGVRAMGDGKTYLLKVETGQPWSYIQRFTTDAVVWRTYGLPVGGFEPVGRFLDPSPGAPPLDPAMISRVGIYILDKQQGPFQITVSSIDAAV